MPIGVLRWGRFIWYFSIKNRYELTRSGTVLQRYFFFGSEVTRVPTDTWIFELLVAFHRGQGPYCILDLFQQTVESLKVWTPKLTWFFWANGPPRLPEEVRCPMVSIAGWNMDPDWVDVFPIENGDVPASCIGLPEGRFLKPWNFQMFRLIFVVDSPPDLKTCSKCMVSMMDLYWRRSAS